MFKKRENAAKSLKFGMLSAFAVYTHLKQHEIKHLHNYQELMILCGEGRKMVGATEFEPATSWSQTKLYGILGGFHRRTWLHCRVSHCAYLYTLHPVNASALLHLGPRSGRNVRVRVCQNQVLCQKCVMREDRRILCQAVSGHLPASARGARPPRGRGLYNVAPCPRGADTRTHAPDIADGLAGRGTGPGQRRHDALGQDW